jgi:pyruvate kinase
MVWGVTPILCSDESSYDEMMECGRRAALERGMAVPGDRVVVTAGLPMHQAGTTNVMRVEVI